MHYEEVVITIVTVILVDVFGIQKYNSIRWYSRLKIVCSTANSKREKAKTPAGILNAEVMAGL